MQEFETEWLSCVLDSLPLPASFRFEASMHDAHHPAKDPNLGDADARIDARRLPISDADATLDAPDLVDSPSPSGTASPRSIGPYRLLKKLGEGGMGQVWLAQQTTPLQRQVALKLIRSGMYDDKLLHRFLAERQSLAIMDHPSIAKVFDAGASPDGQPYFVMEYVPGERITTYCDERRLGIRERLELFIRVCEGVQHAHQKAIIHRDLKPANILVVEVDGKPTPRIIDFGLAKAAVPREAEETMVTEAFGFVGTWGFMSPEQADPGAQDVDTRTDVYSLGVVLYVLLTGMLPFDVEEWKKKPFEEVLRQLREDDPKSPSTKVASEKGTALATAERRGMEPKRLASLLRGDLDSITMKALEKNRARRYGTPSDFAADIGRYLRNETVLAVPPSVAYRARKFARRYRAALATACAFALVLIVAAVISIRQSIRANREAAVAQAVNDFLQNDLLGQASAFNQSRPDPDIKVRVVLDRAAQRIQGNFEKQPEVESGIRATMGQTYEDLGQYPEARTQLERALELDRRALGAKDPKTLKAMSRLGRIAWRQGKYPEAEALLGQVLALQRRVLGPEHPETLSSMNTLANAYDDDGQYTQAEALYSQTLEIRRRVLGQQHPDTLYSMMNLANVYDDEGKHAQAEALHSQTLEIHRRVLGPEHPDTLRSMDNLARAYAFEGKHAQAEVLFSQTLEIQRRVLGPEHPDTLWSTNNLANVYDLEGKYAQAEALFSQTLEIRRRVLGPEHPDTLRSMDNLANVYDEQGKYAQAEALHSQTLEIQRRVLGPEHPDTLWSMRNLASVYDEEGKYAQAEALFSQTLEIRRRVLGPDHPDTLLSMDNLAATYGVQGKYIQSEELFRRCLETERRLLGSEHEYIPYALSDFAFMYQLQGKYALAETYAAQALTVRRHALGAEHPQTMTSAADLALAYVSQGKFAESEPLAHEAMEVDQKKQPDDWQRFRAESLLGESLAGEKKYAEAEPLLLEGYQGMLARKHRIDVPDRYHLELAHKWVVQLYRVWGKPGKAAEWSKK